MNVRRLYSMGWHVGLTNILVFSSDLLKLSPALTLAPNPEKLAFNKYSPDFDKKNSSFSYHLTISVLRFFLIFFGRRKFFKKKSEIEILFLPALCMYVGKGTVQAALVL